MLVEAEHECNSKQLTDQNNIIVALLNIVTIYPLVNLLCSNHLIENIPLKD